MLIFHLLRNLQHLLFIIPSLSLFRKKVGFNYETLGAKQEYYVGIRGNTTRIFDIFFRKANSQELQKIKTYRGQAELDYTIWTQNSVFLFEAKQVRQGSIEYYLDIGWHKFVYAGVRFLNYQTLTYILYNPNSIRNSYEFSDENDQTHYVATQLVKQSNRFE